MWSFELRTKNCLLINKDSSFIQFLSMLECLFNEPLKGCSVHSHEIPILPAIQFDKFSIQKSFCYGKHSSSSSFSMVWKQLKNIILYLFTHLISIAFSHSLFQVNCNPSSTQKCIRLSIFPPPFISSILQ